MRQMLSLLRGVTAVDGRCVALATMLAAAALVTPARSQGRPADGDTPTTQRIVLFRHGEKPQPEGFGQLSCKGLNRALSLPAALSRYGAPTHLFAPDPAVPYYPDVSNAATPATGRYSYVRPLITIEMLAIALPGSLNRPSLPVDVQYPYYKADDLANELLQPKMYRSNTFIAWEHVNLTTIAHDIMQRFTKATGQVPDVWDDDDYDSIYVITVERGSDGTASARFERACEGLGDGGRACPLPPGRPELSSTCPVPAAGVPAVERR